MRIVNINSYLARTGKRLKLFAEDWQAAIHKEDAALGRGGRG